MRIPEGPRGTPAEGKPTLRTSHIRAYGGAGMVLNGEDDLRGCPRQYKAKYVERRVTEGEQVNLLYGQALHQALYRMEEDMVGPEDALASAWPAQLPIEQWTEAKADLDAYLERGGPMATYGTIDVEVELYAKLYDDEEHGEVWFGGRLDWLGIDVTAPQVLHLVDYKTNRFPPSRDSVKNDVQLIGYDWLVRQNWSRIMGDGAPNVVVHLDAIKWYDVEDVHSLEQLEEWRDWASAIARRILRDEEGRPQLNPGCSWCPVKLDCPEFGKLPELGKSLDAKRAQASQSLEQLVAWQDEAKETRKALDAGIEEVNRAVESEAHALGGQLRVGDSVFEVKERGVNVCDNRRAHEILGDSFYDVANVSKAAVGRLPVSKGVKEQVEWECFEKLVDGTRVVRRKADDDEA